MVKPSANSCLFHRPVPARPDFFLKGRAGLRLCFLHAVIGSEWRPMINRLEQLRPVPRVGRRPSFIQADPHLAALTVEARFQHLDHAP